MHWAYTVSYFACSEPPAAAACPDPTALPATKPVPAPTAAPVPTCPAADPSAAPARAPSAVPMTALPTAASFAASPAERQLGSTDHLLGKTHKTCAGRALLRMMERLDRCRRIPQM